MITNLNYCFKLKLKMFVKIFKKAKESNYYDEANNLKNEICKVKDQKSYKKALTTKLS